MLKLSSKFFIFYLFTNSILAQNIKQWEINSIQKPIINPILTADSTLLFKEPFDSKIVAWQKAEVFNPAAIVRNGKIHLLYRCEDNSKAILGEKISRIGLAISSDGITFLKRKQPVLYPKNDAFKIYDYPGGCEDPRVVQAPNGEYIMAYTSWNNKTARLSIATSKDLIIWKKTGPAFAKAYNGKYLDLWSKSGSIITKYFKGRPIAAKINNKYWMYWGEKFINLAWSENLTDWFPTEDYKGELKQLIAPRPGYFDSDLTECGPPAVITNKGIVLLYNGKNATDEKANQSVSKGMYSVGQIIFDINNMENVIERSSVSFLKPTLAHELTGQYKAGTTFAEGLVFFKNKWWLYYGTADSYVGVAIME
jgi:predicted GH43/DUF377 family glycosyl hydrolase